jgi:tetratricopeptide (TPR) repeat protein
MRRFNQILAPFLVFLLLAPSQPLLARTRKGDKFRAQAKVEEGKGDYDKALGYAEQAIAEDPVDPAYMIELRRLRFLSGSFHVKQGQKMRSGGKIEEALAEFKKSSAPRR